MATLKLKDLHCKRKNDITGLDEPRIRVDGVAIWNGAVAKGATVSIDASVDFDGQVNVIAEEMNGAKAQQIGDAAVVRESGNPSFLTFKTSGTWYEVHFDVTTSTASGTTSR